MGGLQPEALRGRITAGKTDGHEECRRGEDGKT
jgi:hypothetical protein